MSSVLLANPGAEEGRAPGRGVRPVVRRVARQWALLFGSDARLLEHGPIRWPLAWGEPPAAPAWAWQEPRDPRSASPSGFAWLPTEDAWRRLSQCGAEVQAAPPEVVRRVHDKGFALDVVRREGAEPESLVDLVNVLEPDELRGPRAVEDIAARVRAWPSWTGRRFVLKPRWGSSGRGHVRGGEGELRAALAGGVREAFALRGGAVLEPWLERREDFSVQLHVGEGGVSLLGTTRQLVSPAGGVVGNRGVVDTEGRGCAGSEHEGVLVAAATRVAEAAAAEGFRGPCGTDAFTCLGPRGREELRPVVELNARFTTGTIALGVLRRSLAARGRSGPCRAWAWLLPGAPSGARPAAASGVSWTELDTESNRPPLLALAESAPALERALRTTLGAGDR